MGVDFITSFKKLKTVNNSPQSPLGTPMSTNKLFENKYMYSLSLVFTENVPVLSCLELWDVTFECPLNIFEYFNKLLNTLGKKSFPHPEGIGY